MRALQARGQSRQSTVQRPAKTLREPQAERLAQ
jgi:hypothetical protein